MENLVLKVKMCLVFLILFLQNSIHPFTLFNNLELEKIPSSNSFRIVSDGILELNPSSAVSVKCSLGITLESNSTAFLYGIEMQKILSMDHLLAFSIQNFDFPKNRFSREIQTYNYKIQGSYLHQVFKDNTNVIGIKIKHTFAYINDRSYSNFSYLMDFLGSKVFLKKLILYSGAVLPIYSSYNTSYWSEFFEIYCGIDYQLLDNFYLCARYSREYELYKSKGHIFTYGITFIVPYFNTPLSLRRDPSMEHLYFSTYHPF